MEEAFRSVFVAAPAVGTMVGVRVAWDVTPQGDGLPAICLHKIARLRDRSTQGASGMVATVVQVDCWGESAQQALDLARAAEAVLADLKSDPFIAAFVEDERSDFEAGDGPRLSEKADFYRTSLDVRVWHSQH